jgi:hypothetical protein
VRKKRPISPVKEADIAGKRALYHLKRDLHTRCEAREEKSVAPLKREPADMLERDMLTCAELGLDFREAT